MADMAEVLQRLYVAPTIKSLETFKVICCDRTLSSNIIELVFLGKVLDVSGCAADPCTTTEEYMAECKDANLNWGVEIPNGYVLTTRSGEVSFDVYGKMVDDYTGEPEETFEVLSEYLPRLTNLSRVKLSPDIDKPGVNEDAFFYATNYRNGTEVAMIKSPDGGVRLARGVATDLGTWMATGVFFKALAESTVKITELEIGNQLGIDRLDCFISGSSDEAPESKDLEAIAANLTHLVISVADNEDKVDAEIWDRILAAAINLESLRIYPDWGRPGIPHSAQEFGTVFGMVLRQQQTFHRLRTFEIIGQLDQPTNVRASWLKPFLARHAATLRHLDLSGTLLVNWYNADALHTTMRSTLQSLKTILPDLISAKLLVDRRDEHAQRYCWRNEDGSKCTGGCTRYMPAEDGAPWMSRDVIALVARDLNVELQDGKWDFGKYLMR
ncbi:hypothetical protein LTR37_000254 [Vermiconidia calcicola]|uniref:Uncharacterized protein n=1 Tax=Vermiconidia calcicola TaxID=1690605 RepID=A0ACC3NZW5_9PEZI|nr:hypothetical protein LTR37_000254 [Vermiconidia calcicola]